MMSPRFIVTLLVTAQIVAYSVGDLMERVRVGIIDPLLYLIWGPGTSYLHLGPFDIGSVVGGLISCIVSILLGLLILRLVFGIAWRWLGRLISDPQEPKVERTSSRTDESSVEAKAES